MLQSKAELTAVLRGTMLQKRKIVRIEPLGPGYEAVLAVDVEGLDWLQAWQVLRERVGQTGRWPVLTSWFPEEEGAFLTPSDAEELFSRFYFSEERSGARGGDTPADILKAAQHEDLASALADLAVSDEDSEAACGLTPEEAVLIEQEVTQDAFGVAPEIDDAHAFVVEHGLSKPMDMDSWFLRWELAHGDHPLDAPADDGWPQDWYEDEDMDRALLLMPFMEGEATLAYINWLASSRRNSQFLVALLRSWREKYGAELVVNDGTVLQLVVARPPTTLEDAYALARQHQLIAPDTLGSPRISLRNHARALLHADRWSLFVDLT